MKRNGIKGEGLIFKKKKEKGRNECSIVYIAAATETTTKVAISP